MESEVLLEYKRITGKDIAKFFAESLDFFRSDYINIVQYFSGKSKNVSSYSFSRFEQLQQYKREIYEGFHSHCRLMKDSRWWDLLEQLEGIDNRFSTLQKINKWSRSSATSVAYSPTIQIDHILQQQQTLERVAKDVLEQNNFQDSWVDIALSNNLSEDDYTSEGGVALKLQLEGTVNLGITVNSVVDYLSGKSIYGKDIDRVFAFVDNDIRVLNYDDTIRQSVIILILLKKNDLSDYPNLGLQKSVIVGSNRALMNFPIIMRQLSESFSSNDTLKEFQVKQIRTEQDNLVVEYSVKTRLNELKTGSMLL